MYCGRTRQANFLALGKNAFPFVSIEQLGDLSLVVSDFHKGLDLISFNLAVMFVVHRQLQLTGQEALNAKHSQQPSLQLIKVALRA